MCYEMIVFVGIQATGKSSFYQQKFAASHMRINLDMLKTRHREKILLHACIEAKQSFVVDILSRIRICEIRRTGN
jgi:hypothetical protein